ncbi:hypothetical protein HanHA300_Chr14g0511801 [Helianthus annuus]|nr:hypothetical protein HanHA300_Chr14g0511791 [Helianthus annuus]KAJ0463134.1 hypothetical protein HanHA300_Chr14g0511801 [Helianthus annuus]
MSAEDKDGGGGDSIQRNTPPPGHLCYSGDQEPSPCGGVAAVDLNDGEMERQRERDTGGERAEEKRESCGEERERTGGPAVEATDRRSEPRTSGLHLYPISFPFSRDFGTNPGVWFECCSGRLRSVSVRRSLVLSDESSGRWCYGDGGAAPVGVTTMVVCYGSVLGLSWVTTWSVAVPFRFSRFWLK